MTISRQDLRAAIGKELGRSLYLRSVTTGVATTTENLIDTKRSEDAAYWDGAALYTQGQETVLRGGQGHDNSLVDPQLFFDRPITLVQSGQTYELLKGWDFGSMNGAIDDAVGALWPELYDPVDDDTTLEVDGNLEYGLAPQWRDIIYVERQLVGTNPARFERLVLGYHYTIRQDPLNQLYIARYLPKNGVILRFVGWAIPQIGSSDAAETVHPKEVIVAGALAYLYEKGPQADQTAIAPGWERKAALWRDLYEKRKAKFAMSREAYDNLVPQIRTALAPGWPF